MQHWYASPSDPHRLEKQSHPQQYYKRSDEWRAFLRVQQRASQIVEEDADNMQKEFHGMAHRVPTFQEKASFEEKQTAAMKAHETFKREKNGLWVPRSEQTPAPKDEVDSLLARRVAEEQRKADISARERLSELEQIRRDGGIPTAVHHPCALPGGRARRQVDPAGNLSELVRTRGGMPGIGEYVISRGGRGPAAKATRAAEEVLRYRQWEKEQQAMQQEKKLTRQSHGR